ncbi:MAG TPA: phosphatase PAP2-related protein [Bacteroidia bacterium]|nr:phosphatase PAP2-related protein [Bacteroidia bacterium]
MGTITTENNFSSAWKYYWAKKNFRIQFIISLFVLASFMVIFPYFFDYVESRNGQLLNDPLLEWLPAADVSLLIMSLLYFGVISWILASAKTPDILLAGIQTYCLVTMLRLISIPLFPLEPPMDYIPLKEPFVQFFTNGGRIISKDLFFSGHMTTILICYYNIRQGTLKKIYFASAIILGVLLMVQHVHYAIDIIAAPLFTWLCFIFVKKVFAKRI